MPSDAASGPAGPGQLGALGVTRSDVSFDNRHPGLDQGSYLRNGRPVAKRGPRSSPGQRLRLSLTRRLMLCA